jgi:nitrite reductase/ring-hydroxylating ferredoxin subunit
MLGRMLTRLIDAQGRWADPLGGTLDGLISPILGRLPRLKDALNGTWLGHPLHATLTDVPIGSLTLMVILDVLGQDVAADIALGIGVLTMLAAAISGSADFADTHGRDRTVSTVHATVMVIALLVLLVALILRLVGEQERALGVPLAFVGYLILIGGAYVGGEIVFALGYPVDRHAWRSPEAGWQRLDIDDIPEGRPVPAEVGSEPIVIVRHGADIDALHGTCAHAGGPLAEGSLEDGCIICPWHGSRFELASGQRRRGPSVHDQPRFEIRQRPDGGFEARAIVQERS